jgi:hypothetical protein
VIDPMTASGLMNAVQCERNVERDEMPGRAERARVSWDVERDRVSWPVERDQMS